MRKPERGGAIIVLRAFVTSPHYNSVTTGRWSVGTSMLRPAGRVVGPLDMAVRV